jgi:GNAT superfamily N-acetyltransferase
MESDVTIRIAQVKDIGNILYLCRAWFDEGQMEAQGLRYDENAVVRMAVNLISNNVGVYLLAERDGIPLGMICGFHDFWLGDPEQKMLHETFWWIDPDERGTGLGDRMLEAFNAYRKGLGFEYTLMIDWQPGGPRALGNYYRKRGYEPLQTYYWKKD